MIRCTSNASPKTFIPDDVLSVIEQYQKNKSTIKNSTMGGKAFIISDGDRSKRDGNKQQLSQMSPSVCSS